MTTWIILGLLAPLCWGTSNALDSAARRHFVQDDMSMTWFLAITRIPLLLLLFWIGGFSPPALSTVLIMLVVGFLWLIPFVLYYRAIEFEEPSRIALVLQMLPLFTLVAAYLVLGEQLNTREGMAFILLLIAGVLATLKHFSGMWRLSKAFWLISLANVIWALCDVLFKKYAPEFTNFTQAFAFDMMGGFLFAPLMLLFAKSRKKIHFYFSKLSGRGWVLLSIDQAIGICGSAAFGYALLLGKVSLTSVFLVIQPLVALLMGLILGRFIAEVEKEDVTRKSLIFKVAALACTLVGLVFLI